MTLLITDDSAGIHAARAGLADRLMSRARSARLDMELARGVPPESTMALAVHAERLTRPEACRQLARTLRRILADVQRPRSAVRPAVPLCGAEIGDARRQIEALAARLVAAGPVSACGVAQVRVLLADGVGPIYRDRAGSSLRARVGRALAALDPA